MSDSRIVEIEAGEVVIGDIVLDWGKVQYAHIEPYGAGLVNQVGDWRYFVGKVQVIRKVDGTARTL